MNENISPIGVSVSGDAVFYTPGMGHLALIDGTAGCGHSVTMRTIIDALCRDQTLLQKPLSVHVCTDFPEEYRICDYANVHIHDISETPVLLYELDRLADARHIGMIPNDQTLLVMDGIYDRMLPDERDFFASMCRKGRENGVIVIMNTHQRPMDFIQDAHIANTLTFSSQPGRCSAELDGKAVDDVKITAASDEPPF